MKINVGVFFGGKSTEHEVSVISALQAIENIDKEKYYVIPVYIDKKGDFYIGNGLTELANYRNIKNLLSQCRKVTLYKNENKTYITEIHKNLFANKDILIDVAFPIVHGTNVEDGNLQGYFHTLNLPVVGPDCLAAGLSMDKYVMKEYWKAIGIPVIDGIRFDKNDFKNKENIAEKVEKELGYPVIIKPVNLGSSIGIKKANNREQLFESIELAFTFSDIILIEKAIVNLREINCAVIGDKFSCECSALEEPFGKDEILSFTDKYLSGGATKGCKNSNMNGNKLCGTKTVDKVGISGGSKGMASLQRKIPAELDDKKTTLIKEYAMKAFKFLGCSGVSRIDFIIDKDTDKIYANEINSIPGSLSYYLFEPIGIKYKELLDKLITISIRQYKEKNNLNFVFESNILG